VWGVKGLRRRVGRAEGEEGEEGCPCELGGWGRAEFWWRPGMPRACSDWHTAHRPTGGAPDAFGPVLADCGDTCAGRCGTRPKGGGEGRAPPSFSGVPCPQGRPFLQVLKPLAPPLPPTPDFTGPLGVLRPQADKQTRSRGAPKPLHR